LRHCNSTSCYNSGPLQQIRVTSDQIGSSMRQYGWSWSYLLAAVALWCGVSVESVCPFHFEGTPASNNDPSVPAESVYSSALDSLDIAAVFGDLYALMTDSQECWPADSFGGEQSYGPLFIRLAWHCSGSYRATDGLGGCAGGRQRFQPESAWDDNTNLDKARALLYPIKEKYGDSLSWGDLFVFAGDAAILSMGGPVSSVCAGRIDDADGSKSEPLDDPEGLCEEQGNCQPPLGASTVGLIYVNPAGVMGEPVPSKSAPRIREVFGRMGMNDSETVALIGGGHAFGKCHGACTLGAGHGPDVDAHNPWPGNCGSGVAEDTFTSGFEGEWTATPLQWSNYYFEQLVEDNYTLWTGPGGNPQWRNDQNGLMMLTTDLALVADDEYKAIVTEFADDITSLNTAFSAAWKKLTESGNDANWADNRFCVDADTLNEEEWTDEEIECGQTLSGTMGSRPDSASLGFVNDEVQSVTFTNCDSDFDTTMFLTDSSGDQIQRNSDNQCDGDDCRDPEFCSTPYRETFTMSDLEVGSYTLSLTPYSYGGHWSVTVHCVISVPTEEPTQHPTRESTDTLALEMVTWHARPSELWECQGDCDYDIECVHGFECYHDGKPPGCSGTAAYSADYCYDPRLTMETTSSIDEDEDEHVEEGQIASAFDVVDTASWTVMLTNKDLLILVLVAVNVVIIVATCCLRSRRRGHGSTKYRVVAVAESDTEQE